MQPLRLSLPAAFLVPEQRDRRVGSVRPPESLDLASRGRVEFGMGESASITELEPFDEEKRAVWEDSVRAVIPMFREGGCEYHGTHFGFPLRNVRALWGGLIGSPETLRRRLRRFETSHIDPVILLNQAGKNAHEHICESLELFAREVMPEFHAHEPAQQAWKRQVLSRARRD